MFIPARITIRKDVKFHDGTVLAPADVAASIERARSAAPWALAALATVRVDGALIYADATLLEPRTAAVAGAGVLDGRRYLVSGFWYAADVSAGCRGQTPDAPLHTVSSRNWGQTPDGRLHTLLVAFGQSAPGRVFLRALGDDGRALDRVVRDALARVADAWKVPPLRLERFRC